MQETNEIKRALSRGIKTAMQHTPFEELTVGNIAAAAAVSRRSFYRYFRDKYELLNWVYYDDFIGAMPEKKVERALDLYPFVCANLYKDRLFFINAFNVRGQNSFREFCSERLAPYIERDLSGAFSSEWRIVK